MSRKKMLLQYPHLVGTGEDNLLLQERIGHPINRCYPVLALKFFCREKIAALARVRTEFRSCKSQWDFKASGVGLLRKFGEQTKNSS